VKPEQVPSTALATVAPAAEAVNVWDDLRLQRLWLGVERREWRSLSVLGTSRSVATLAIAELIAQLAWRYRGQPSSVYDLRDLGMRLVDYEVREIQAQVESGMRLVVALRPIFENPTASLIAKQTDAVLLCIALGESSFKAADEAIAAVGRQRILGSIVLRPRDEKRRAKANGG
jgi:hypothetical protein